MLIGLTGYAKHGKDATGALLVKEFGFERYAFADALKSMALVLNPIIQTYKFPKHAERLATLVNLKGWDKAKEDPEVRRFLQVLGTEGVRDHLGENAWVQALELELVNNSKIWYSYHPSDGRVADGVNIVVTDVRFPNESGWVAKMAGLMVRVVRVNPDGSSFDNGIGTDHPSERFINDLKVDYVVAASTLDELHDEVREMMVKYDPH